MKFYQEITEWNTSFAVPNHIYYMNDSKTRAVGYIKAGTTKLIKFSSPMSIDTRGRKFKEINRSAESDELYFQPTEQKMAGIQVAGSNGKVYTIVKSSGGRITCSCPGFTFRNTCKHIKEHS
jgi:hypothetical protein